MKALNKVLVSIAALLASSPVGMPNMLNEHQRTPRTKAVKARRAKKKIAAKSRARNRK